MSSGTASSVCDRLTLGSSGSLYPALGGAAILSSGATVLVLLGDGLYTACLAKRESTEAGMQPMRGKLYIVLWRSELMSTRTLSFIISRSGGSSGFSS